MGESNLIIDF